MVAGDERLTFAELDRMSESVAHGLVARGIAKGDRVGIAMRNCPSWVVVYMAHRQGGRRSRPCSTAGGKPHEMEHAITLTDPKLIIADAPRAQADRERCAPIATS